MDNFRVYQTDEFKIEFEKLFDKHETLKFKRFVERIKINPYQGNPLRVTFVREFKSQKGKRAYFLVYEDIKKVLFIAVSNKKTQQKIIDSIFNNLSGFRIFVE